MKERNKRSPFGKLNIQVVDMLANTEVNLNGLEKEVNNLESLQPSKQRPECLDKTRVINVKDRGTRKIVKGNNRWLD